MTTNKRLLVAAVLFLVVPQGFAAPRKDVNVVAMAGSCSTRQIASCDSETFGTLETGDCLFDDGSRFDRYTFNGRAGDVVEVMVRPLTPTYTKPWIALVSPLGDVAEPPIISGGSGGATIWYKLSSSGTWTIVVSSEDVFAGGSYVVHYYCYPPEPEEPQSCIFQNLLCGQSAAWSLNADSCKFQGDDRVYAGWWIWAVQGDRLRFEMTAFGFEPLFGLYRENELLRSSTRDTSFRAEMSHLVRETGWHYFLTTSVEDGEGGDIDVTLNCEGSGCTWPYLVSAPPSSMTVDRGTSVTIPFTVNAVGGYTVKLTDPNPVTGTVYATAPAPATSITTPPVTHPSTYVLEAENECGSWVSSPFTVAPEVGRRRSVRK
ncbi:MAG TPA: hypothetical protein VGF28_06995 [Thermoanaerobaculia bacterium]|jgi:hypothetical protein